MSIRDKFQQAQKDGEAVRKAADMAILDKALATFLKKLPQKLEQIIADKAAGLEAADEEGADQVRMTAKCKAIGPHQIRKEDLEALPGYRALVAACQSPENDVCIFIRTENQSTPISKGSSTSRVEFEAQLTIFVMPALPYAESRLDLRSGHYGSYKDSSYDAAALSLSAPSPAAAPEAPVDEKISVLSPIKIKDSRSAKYSAA